MATGRPPETAPGNKQASTQATTPEQQANIRLVFQSELGIAQAQLINVESTVLYNALSTKRHADIDAEDDGSLHSEVLKNAIDLLQRFHRCAPLYLKMAAGHRQRNNNFFAKDIFCRTFCSDIKGFDNKDNPRAWIDVFHFFQAMKKIWDGSLLGGLRMSNRDVVAAGFEARDEVAKAETRSRKGVVLWELMGLASKAIDRNGNTKPRTWCVEAAVRLGMWRKRLKEDSDSLFHLPVEDYWGNHSDFLPHPDDDAMKLFQALEAKLCAFYRKCNEQMPEQAIFFAKIPKLPAWPAPPEADQVDGTRDQQSPEDMIQRDGTSEEMTLDITVRDESQDISPQKTDQEGSMLSSFIPLGNKVPSRNISRKKGHRQRALTLRAYDQQTPRTIITHDPSKSTAPRDAVRVTLEQAKELITDVLRANGKEPDWEPELTRMVISASLRLNGSS